MIATGIGIGPRFGGPPSLILLAINAIRRNNGTLIYVPTAYTGAYTDSTGTTPATTVGDVLGLLTDRSYGAGGLGAELVTSGAVTLIAGGQQAVTGSTIVSGRSYRVTIPAGVSMAITSGWSVVGNGSTQVVVANGTGQAQVYSASGAGPFTPSIREVLGSHATQATTANKPLLSRVPKRLGPNLVVNGTFDSGTTGWAVQAGGTISNVSGTLEISGANFNAYQSVAVSAGKSYQVSYTPVSNGSQCVVSVGYDIGQSQLYGVGSLTTQQTFTVSPASASMFFSVKTLGAAARYDNITVQEVLEWSNAISFDGSNDFLQTGITTGNEGWFCVGVVPSAAPAVQHRYVGNGGTSISAAGVFLAESPTTMQIQTSNGIATQTLILNAAWVVGPRVASGGWNATTLIVGKDSIESSVGRTIDPTSNTPTTVGVSPSQVYHYSGPMTATVYTPVLPNATDRALIRRFIGSLQGQTL